MSSNINFGTDATKKLCSLRFSKIGATQNFFFLYVFLFFLTNTSQQLQRSYTSSFNLSNNRHCVSIIFYVLDILIIILQLHFYTFCGYVRLCSQHLPLFNAALRCGGVKVKLGKTSAFIRSMKRIEAIAYSFFMLLCVAVEWG